MSKSKTTETLAEQMHRHLCEIGIQHVASRILGIKTLETQKSDHQDFHWVAVWQLKKALAAAYEAGFKNALS